MGRVERSIRVLRFIVFGISVNLFDMQKRQHIAVNVAKRQRLSFRDAVARRDRQRHGQRPERSIGQTHLADNAFIVRLVQKAFQRREAADGQQLEVAQSALVERQAGKVFGGCLHFGGSVRTDEQIDERAAEWRVQSRGRRRGRGLRRCWLMSWQ